MAFTLPNASFHAVLMVCHASAAASKNPLAMTCSASGELGQADRIVDSQRSCLSLVGRSPCAPAISIDVLWKVHLLYMRLMAVWGCDSCRLVKDNSLL